MRNTSNIECQLGTLFSLKSEVKKIYVGGKGSNVGQKQHTYLQTGGVGQGGIFTCVSELYSYPSFNPCDYITIVEDSFL